MDAARSPESLALASSIDELGQRIDGRKEEMVSRLHAAIEGSDAETRRTLLAAKRDCFNGRNVSGRWQEDRRHAVAQVAPDLLQEIIALENELKEKHRDFELVFEREEKRIWHHLLCQLDNPDFAKGMSLASPLLVQNLARLRSGRSLPARKLRGAKQTLLRYVSRAGLKLSPFSTLTRVAQGEVADDDQGNPWVLQQGSATEHASQAVLSTQPETVELRRLNRLTLNRIYALLRQYDPFRSKLLVRLNATFHHFAELEDGRQKMRVVRPRHWAFDAKDHEIKHFEESIITLPIDSKVVLALGNSDNSQRTVEDWAEWLHRAADLDLATASGEANRLIRAGVLLLQPPWTSTDIHPEQCLAQMLTLQLGQDPLCRLIAGNLSALQELLKVSPSEDSRAGIQRQISKHTGEMFEALSDQLELPGLELGKVGLEVHEDIFLASGAGRSNLVSIPRASAEQALRSIHPLVLFSDLNYTRYEFLLTLKAQLEDKWPGETRISLLRALPICMPLWRSHVKHSTSSYSQEHSGIWNPMDLDEVRELNKLRSRVVKNLRASLRPCDTGFEFDLKSATAAVAEIPEHYRPVFGPCLFMQPAEAGGDLWVLNHLLDGTGRFSTRYTTVMPEDQACAYTDHFRKRSELSYLGESVELVDIVCSQNDHLNVHRTQTDRVLALPGERLDLPAERQLQVSDLYLRLDGPLPTFEDPQGKPVKPVFLGATSLFPMPTIVKLLSHISFAEFRLIYPRRPFEECDEHGSRCYPRVTIGNIVPLRKLWTVSPKLIFGDIGRISDVDLYRTVNRWRLSLGIPDQVFVREKLKTEFKLWEIRKPQFIDFTSPSFVSIIRSCFESTPENLEICEVLPASQDFPQDQSGRRWATEIQLEDLTLRPAQDLDSMALNTNCRLSEVGFHSEPAKTQPSP